MRSVRLLVGFLWMAPVWATTSYNTLVSMESANPTLTFQNLSLAPSGDSAASFAFTDGTLDFLFQASSGNLTRTDSPGGWPAGTMLRTTVNSAAITLTIPIEVIAFGATFGHTPAGSPADITIAGDNAGAFTYTLDTSSGTNPQYLGVVGTSSFSTITISSSFFLSRYGLTNFSYAVASGPPQTSETPEPNTMLLIGSGLLILPLMRRMRRFRRPPERSIGAQSGQS